MIFDALDINNDNSTLTTFIDNKDNHFFYTETVKKEATHHTKIIPEVFTYINSGLSDRKKEIAYDELTLNDFFIPLTETNRRKFRNDITIIFEAGFICYDKSIAPSNVTYIPLLTNNLKLYHKFINNPIYQQKIEQVIGLYGMEHLIEIIRPKDVVPNYQL